MHLKYRNVNHAFEGIVSGIHKGVIPTRRSHSRYGDVLVIDEPVVTTYLFPRERVLFNTARDCNPFFHLFESLWMLAGRRDVAPVAYYVQRMQEFSDNGVDFWGAYGSRWRNWFFYDQLRLIADELRSNPYSRRCVLQMWDGAQDLHKAIKGGRDVPCNLSALFLVRCVAGENILDMTVFNRSNDLILGMLGANVVHMSFLQEYMAMRCGFSIGFYNQVSNNLHCYEAEWKPEKWTPTPVSELNLYSEWTPHDFTPLYWSSQLDSEIKSFVEGYNQKCWNSPFLETVAKPMMLAFDLHLSRKYDTAFKVLGEVKSADWRYAGTNWIAKRKANYERRKEKV